MIFRNISPTIESPSSIFENQFSMTESSDCPIVKVMSPKASDTKQDIHILQVASGFSEVWSISSSNIDPIPNTLGSV